MRRIPLAIIVMSILLVIILFSQLYLYSSFNELSFLIEQIETSDNTDTAKFAHELKTTYAQRHRWLLIISDINLILQLKMVIDTLNPGAEPQEIVAHTKHIKAELMRVESLLLAPL